MAYSFNFQHLKKAPYFVLQDKSTVSGNGSPLTIVIKAHNSEDPAPGNFSNPACLIDLKAATLKFKNGNEWE